MSTKSNMIPVWDLITRLFHWALVGLVVTALVAVNMEEMDLHMLAGQLVLALIVFRLMWGLWGSSTSRFKNFIKGPKAVLDYVKGVRSGAPTSYYGHNPAGGWMVAIIIVALLVQASLGLFADDEMFAQGPLSHLVDYYTSQTLSGLHHEFGEMLPWLLVVHVVAIIAYRLKGDNLIVPMLTGKKPEMEKAGDKPPTLQSFVLATLSLGLAFAIVWYVTTQI